MLKIEAIIQASRFEDTKAALEALDIRELIVSEVMDHGHGYANTMRRSAGSNWKCWFQMTPWIPLFRA
jgi:nitrogen regulatory protein PII